MVMAAVSVRTLRIARISSSMLTRVNAANWDATSMDGSRWALKILDTWDRESPVSREILDRLILIPNRAITGATVLGSPFLRWARATGAGEGAGDGAVVFPWVPGGLTGPGATVERWTPFRLILVRLVIGLCRLRNYCTTSFAPGSMGVGGGRHGRW